MTQPLRLITYLTPGLPLELFATIAEAIGPDTVLSSDPRASGPSPEEIDPFSAGTADVGFMCAPAYLALRRRSARPPVELLGLAPVFDDPRAERLPRYFADVVVRADDPSQSFADLEHRRVGYNDPISLSGRLALMLHLNELGRDLSFFSETICTGSHDASLQALSDELIDVATIDSTVFRLRRAAGEPSAVHTRVVATLGPHPVQPIVVSAGLAVALRDHIRKALASLTGDPARLAPYSCLGFSPVSDSSYDALERVLISLPAG